jgi:hypothetical protein
VDDRREVDPLHVEPDLAADDAAHVEQVFDDLRLRASVALNGLKALAQVLGLVRPDREQLRPSEDRVQWRPKFVRERGEALVLHLVGPLSLSPR